MTARRAAVESSRQRILEAFYEIWLVRPYDQMTVEEVAAAAGVARQTVIRQFGTKDQLAVAVVDWLRPTEEASRTVEPGDLDAAVARLVDRYEEIGDANVRLLELEGRLPEVDYALEQARASHRAWIVETLVAPLGPLALGDQDEVTLALYAATDVTLWKLLRRDLGQSRPACEAIIRRLAIGILDSVASPTSPPRKSRQRKSQR